jgi:hypothetical protein
MAVRAMDLPRTPDRVGGVLVVPAALSLVQVGYRGMMVEIFAVAFAVALVVGTVAIAVDLSSMSIPALRNWLDLRGSELAELHRVLTLAFGGSRPRPAPPSGRPAASARPRGRNRSRPRVNHPARTAAQRERTEAAAELAKQEAALAQRERILERSLAVAERSAAEATARIEAREAVLATQEAELQQQESELADRHRSLAERERELIRIRADLRAPAENPGAVESDWWEKQLGHPRSAKGARRPR